MWDGTLEGRVFPAQLIEGPKNPAAEGHFTVTAKLGPTTMTSAMSCSLFLPHCMIRQMTIENHTIVIKWVLSIILLLSGSPLSLVPRYLLISIYSVHFDSMSMTRPRVGTRGCGQPNFSEVNLAENLCAAPTDVDQNLAIIRHIRRSIQPYHVE